MELNGTPQIKFANGKSQVMLDLKPKKASRFDFLIGVLPSGSGTDRSFIITGDFTAEMHNRLGQGEYIFAQFQRLRPAEDFLELIADAGILYQLNSNALLKASWKNKTSRLIAIDTADIIQKRILPTKLDISYNGGGLEYRIQDLDYRFNPSKGWEMNISGSVGLKKLIRNRTIESIDNEGLNFEAAYDSLKLNTLQTDLSLSSAVYFPVLQVGTIKLGVKGALIYNEEEVYENEFFRIGGNKLLRGFDEQTVITDAYLVSTAEFRLLLDRNSYLSLPFIDYGITRISTATGSEYDTAIGFGMGINFSTPAGIFNVSFAAGRRLDNPFDFNNTKIHFGYVSLF